MLILDYDKTAIPYNVLGDSCNICLYALRNKKNFESKLQNDIATLK